VGVYHLARSVTKHLEVKDKEVVDAFCMAALLHDIGHFPFSHSFEWVAKTSDPSVDHERYTKFIVMNSEITERLNKVGIDPNMIIEFMEGRYLRKPELAFLNGLLASELDIDRLDFLLRDSHYCGVSYGKYDLDRLILSMTPHNNEIVITSKGIQSAEIYVLARFNMYVQVYTHKTRRAFDLMLKSMFSKDRFESLSYPQMKKEDIDRLTEFDDSWLMDRIKEVSKSEGDKHRQYLAQGFLSREPIKCVCECSAYSDISGPGVKAAPEFTTISNLCRDINAKEINNLGGVSSEEIWGDEPYGDLPFAKRYRPFSFSGESEKGLIRILKDPDKEPLDIAQVPGSLASVLAKNMLQLARIYAVKEKRITLRDHLKKKYGTPNGIFWYPSA
jgi:hypothetical protein